MGGLINEFVHSPIPFLKTIGGILGLTALIGLLLCGIWGLWLRRGEKFGNLSEFLIGGAAVLFGAASFWVALELANLQRTERQDAALDRVLGTLQWGYRQSIQNDEVLRSLMNETARLGEYDCVIYLRHRVDFTPTWIGTKLHPPHSKYLIEPSVLGMRPEEKKPDMDGVTEDEWTTIGDDFHRCVNYIPGWSNLEPTALGYRIRSLIHNVLEIPDISLAEWPRLKNDEELWQAENQLEDEVSSDFCNSQGWQEDVYELFDKLHEFEKTPSSPAQGFAHTFVQNFPNLDSFLGCVCGPKFGHQPERCPK